MSDVVLTGFCDETCEDKNLERQFAVAAALGLEWISLRFYNLGAGVKNILAADQSDGPHENIAVPSDRLSTS